VKVNQHLLEALGVGHPALERIRIITSKYGLYSKLTGAGGGGCAFTLLSEDTPTSVIAALIEELTGEGFDCFETEIGVSGVLIDVF